MKTIELCDDKSLNLTVKYLLDNKIIFYPTDTIYGLGCRADSKKAVEKIYHLKGRSKNKAAIILISSWKMLSEVAIVSDLQKKYLKTIWPGPVTVILKARLDWPWLMASDGSVALRMPNNNWLKSLIRRLSVPLLSTSANLSGELTISSSDELISHLPVNKIDLAVANGVMAGQPSKIIDLRFFPKISIIRS